MSTFGIILSSHFGKYQAAFPISFMTLGISVIRTINASKRTPKERANPLALIEASPAKSKSSKNEDHDQAGCGDNRTAVF